MSGSALAQLKEMPSSDQFYLFEAYALSPEKEAAFQRLYGACDLSSVSPKRYRIVTYVVERVYACGCVQYLSEKRPGHTEINGIGLERNV